MKKCPICNKMFKKSYYNMKFCSRKCRLKTTKLMRISPELRKELSKMKITNNESYEEIINRLLKGGKLENGK